MGLVPIQVDVLAVFVAALIGMVIGALWYSPLLFGKTWMRLMGLTKAHLKAKKQGMTKVYVLQFIALFVMAYALGIFLSYAGVATSSGVFQTVFWLWLGFQATLELGSVLWAGKSWNLFFLNSAHNLVVLAAMGWALFSMA